LIQCRPGVRFNLRGLSSCSSLLSLKKMLIEIIYILRCCQDWSMNHLMLLGGSAVKIHRRVEVEAEWAYRVENVIPVQINP